MNFTILRFDSIDSTNIEALKQARAGAEEGLCIVARQQSAGRGRRGRTWISEKDAGLYFSVILRPKLEPTYFSLVTLMAGIAVHDTLADLGLKPDIKWVNDVLVDGRKISGILAETTDTSKGSAIVVGIGINLTSGNYTFETAGSATSIETETRQKIEPESLLKTLTRSIESYYSILNSQNGPWEIVRQWCSRSTYWKGKMVRVVTETETVTGITEGIELNGALRLRTPDGVRTVQAGDVERLREKDAD